VGIGLVNLVVFFFDEYWRDECRRLSSSLSNHFTDWEDGMSRRNRPHFGSGFERLEDREVPAITPFTVNSVGDLGDSNAGDGDAWTGQMINVGGQQVKEVTLRAAIEEGNANVVVGNWMLDRYDVMIEVSAAGNTISLGMALPALKSNFQFTGQGVTIQPSAGLALQLFVIKSGVDARFTMMDFRNAHVIGDGGAIQNRGSLTVTHCNFYNNLASFRGGAIASYDSNMETGFAGDLKIQGCSFWLNSAGWNGGAIWADGHTNLFIADTDIFANSATGTGTDPNVPEGMGGGVAVTMESAQVAPLIQNTRIYGNSAGNNSGGVYVYNTALVITGGEIHGNTAYGDGESSYGGWGGGIYVDAEGKTVTLSMLNLTNNEAYNTGGGGYVWKGTLQLQNLMMFSGNWAQESISGVGYKKMQAMATITPDPPPGFDEIEEDP
jgi:hypothetical protein